MTKLTYILSVKNTANSYSAENLYNCKLITKFRIKGQIIKGWSGFNYKKFPYITGYCTVLKYINNLKLTLDSKLKIENKYHFKQVKRLIQKSVLKNELKARTNEKHTLIRNYKKSIQELGDKISELQNDVNLFNEFLND